MSKMFLKFGLGLLAFAAAAGPLAAAAPNEKSLHGHVPAVVAHLAKTGEVADANDMRLAIGLQLRNQDALDQLLQQVTDPSSPNYQHYLTPEDFTKQFGPTEQDYQAVIQFAREHGMQVTATHSNRMLVEVSGKASKIKEAFKVSLHTYQHPKENRTFFAPDKEPTVPANLAILDVSGLNNYARPHAHLQIRPNATNLHSSATSNLGSGPIGTYMGNDFRAAYVPGATQTGSGQKVALVQFDGYFASDIAQYESMAGLPTVSLTNIC